MSNQKHLPYDEFTKMWYDHSIGTHYIAKYFDVADQTILSFAKRCKLNKKNEQQAVIGGGLPRK